MSEHPDSEQLALLAMESDVDDSVRQHLTTCAECQGDVALLKSLLAADGPDRNAAASGEDVDRLAVDPGEAQADGNDTARDSRTATPHVHDDQAEPSSTTQTSSGQGINHKALLVVVLIVLVSIALAVVFLR